MKQTQSVTLPEEIIKSLDMLTRFGLVDSRSHAINEALQYYIDIFDGNEFDSNKFIELIKNNFEKRLTLNNEKYNIEHH